jgi:hypothetical protein
MAPSFIKIIQTIFIIASDVLLYVAGLLVIVDATVQLVRSAVRAFRAPYPNNVATVTAREIVDQPLHNGSSSTDHPPQTIL